jgi:hypothetical protein
MALMSDAEIATSQHIHSCELSKWRGVLIAQQVAEFERQRGDVIAGLGYSHAAPAHDAVSNQTAQLERVKRAEG